MSECILQAVGDSLTTGDSGTRGWLPPFQDLTDADVLAYNLGIGGDTSAGVRERFASESRRRAHDWSPVVVVFEVGVNDSQIAVETGERQVPLSEFEANVRALREQATEIADLVRFVDIAPVDERVDPMDWKPTHAYRPDAVTRYDERLRAVVPESERIPVRERFEDRTHDLLADGVHPNEAGNELIAEAVVRALDGPFELLDD